METALDILKKQLRIQENSLDNEFKNRIEYCYDFNDEEVYEHFNFQIKVIRDLRKAINFLNT